MNIATPMFLSDCVVIGVYIQLLWNIRAYRAEVTDSRERLSQASAAGKHARSHHQMTSIMAFSIGIYTAMKIVDTVLQVGHPYASSPMELWTNGATALIGLSISMLIFHLRDEENADHPFYFIETTDD